MTLQITFFFALYDLVYKDMRSLKHIKDMKLFNKFITDKDHRLFDTYQL